MRLSDLKGKEIINFANGRRLGFIDDCELVLEKNTGIIQGIVIPQRRSTFSFKSNTSHIVISWQAIKRIGDDILIVDLGDDEDFFDFS